jgi:phosphonate transport system ATP-binding protein
MPMLELTSARKKFGDVTAIDDVSLTIRPGEMVGIIGRSGAGKSTLLRLINRLTELDSGRIAWDGEDVTRFRGRALRSWRARSAMIFQNYNLVERLDVITNVLIGCIHHRPLLPTLVKSFSAADRARATIELHRVGMADKALHRAETLSGGQMQRVAIARAMMQEPNLLLADEPVSSLDPYNATLVMRALAAANKERGITVIINTHTIDLARRFCDRIVGMEAGRIVFDGHPSALDEHAEAGLFGNSETYLAA